MKICLINPILFSFQRVRSRLLKNNVGMSFYPPLGLCYIANMLEKNGIKVKVIDRNSLMTKNHSNQLVVDDITEGEIRKFKPDIVGITVTTPTFFDVRCNIVRIIRKTSEETVIVVGGPHVSALPEDTLRSCNAIDIACRGEGELSMLEIARGYKLEDIVGITYRDGDNIINNQNRKPHDDINDFCFPSRHLVDMKYYCKGNPHVMHGIYSRATTIFTSRGCPYNCTFCAGSVALGRGVRFQSVELVIEEIEILIKDYKIEGLYFADDIFDVDKDRAVNICRKIIEKNIHKKIYWNAQLRANSMDKNLLKLMKEAGCIRVDVGFESGSQKTLDIINKKTTVAQNYKAAELLHEVGIQIHANMIVGLPGEDMEDLNKTRNFMKNIRPNWIGFGEFIPLPGSKLFDELSDRSLISKENVEVLEGLNFTKLDDENFYKFVKDVRNKIVNPIRLKNYILQNWKKPSALLYMLRLIVEFLVGTCQSTLKSFLLIWSKHIRMHDKQL